MKIILALALVILGCNAFIIDDHKSVVSELPARKTKLSAAELKRLDSVNIHFQLRGNCYAYSSNKNAIASNGEWQSGNYAKKVDAAFPKVGVYLVINQNELIKIDSTKLGCKLYLVNTSDSLIKISASDSRLYIVAEALDQNNEWKPITYLPSSWCGNSYHTVMLDKDEFWEFEIPVFKGKMKTKIRYSFSANSAEKIYSNEVTAFINKDQLDPKKQQGHNSSNIMDPYED
jgi:hypothetical protein